MFLPSGKRQNDTRQFNNNRNRSGRQRKKFDDIEEAEYEDLSNQDN